MPGVTFATGLFVLIRPSGIFPAIFSAGFAASAGLRDVFPTGFAVPVGLMTFRGIEQISSGRFFSVFSLVGFAPTTGCGVTSALALVRAEDDERSTDVVLLFVDGATAG